MTIVPRCALRVAVTCAIVLAQVAAAPQTEPPSAQQYYANAIEAMRDVPQANYTTYDVHVHMTGLGFMLTADQNGKAEIAMVLHDRRAKPDATFPAAHRKSDDATSVQTPQGQWGTVSLPLFDPTWSGVDDWIRYGVGGRPDSATVASSPPPALNGLPVIVTVRAMGVAFYDVSDGGAATCANGDPAHRVHLIARRDPLNHPLTDASIDERTGHFCFLRFEVRQSVVAAGYASTFEVNLADVNGESLIRSGTIELTLRAMGIGVKRIAMTIAYDHFAFPATLANEIFPPA